jgi:hypothetical protein
MIVRKKNKIIQKIAPREKDTITDRQISTHATHEKRLYGFGNENHEAVAKGKNASMILTQSLDNIPIGLYKYRNWVISSKPISVIFVQKNAKKNIVNKANTTPIPVNMPKIKHF